MHQNQVGQNLHLVKKSFKKKEILKEMPDLQFMILLEFMKAYHYQRFILF